MDKGFNKPKKHVADPTPPLAEDLLIRVFKSWRLRNKSKHIPLDNLEAANWWMAHQEERQYSDLPEPMTDKDGNVKGWSTPYHDRVVYNLRRFLKMSEPEKAYIIHHIERDVPYRGDSIDFYKQVVDQAAIMAQDPDTYRDDALRELSKIFGTTGG